MNWSIAVCLMPPFSACSNMMEAEHKLSDGEDDFHEIIAWLVVLIAVNQHQ